MRNLFLESAEVNGAIKLLTLLQHDWQFSIVPAVYRKIKEELKVVGNAEYMQAPLENKYRTLAGEGMVRFLLSDKENMRRFLLGDVEELKRKYIRDKKGKVVRIDISF